MYCSYEEQETWVYVYILFSKELQQIHRRLVYALIFYVHRSNKFSSLHEDYTEPNKGWRPWHEI
jgi:hypothetical protein